MEIRKNISAPFTGMNRDSNLDRLQDGEFTFALNSDSNGRVRTNEPSNYLYTIFPEGYRVISHPLKDKLKNRTYYWLTNPDTGFSSFGYVIDRKTYHDNTDLETNCSECDSKNQLSTPLEDITQTPEFEYVELFHDRCLPKGEGLNLDINFPIKSPVLKSEISGTVVYWEDDKNPPRYVKVDDVSYLYQQDIPCEDPQETPCLQVRKLLQFPDSEPLHVEAISQNIGGNLRRGSYEVFACYSDALGSEMSEYSSSSNVIKIFDINNNVLEPQNLDDYTNYAIKIRINNLDYKNFQYYKIVVVERGVTDSNPIAFEEGIFPTSTEEVVITSSGRVYNTPNNRVTNLQTKKVVDLNTIFLRKPKIERAKGEAIIGDRKYIYGVKRKEQLNIQPVVNLFSSLAQWQTVCTTEKVYEDGVLASKYGTYPRTETQAFGIRFLQKDGGKSEVFPMVGRPPIPSDLEEVSEEVKIKSSCGDTERNKRWQYFDTATKTEQLFSNIEGVEVSQIETKSCLISGVYTIPQNNITIQIEQDFTNLQDYLEENPDVNIPEITPYLNNTYPSSHCYPPFGIVRTSGELVVGKKYVIHQVNAGDDFSNTGFTNLHEPFIAIATHPNSWVSGTEVEETTCGEAVLQEESVSIATVVNEEVEKEEAKFPDDYSPINSSGCNIYEIGDDGKPQRDKDFEFLYDSPGCDNSDNVRSGGKIFKRIYNFSNESCPLAENIPIISGVNSQYQKYWFRLLGTESPLEIITNKISTALPPGQTLPSHFFNEISKTALWFKGVIQGYDNFILEISATQNPSQRDVVSGKPGKNQYQEVRVSLFNKCSDQSAIFTRVIRATSGMQWLIRRVGDSIKIEDKDYPGVIHTLTPPNPFPGDSFYIAIDPPVLVRQGAAFVDEHEDGYDRDCNEYPIQPRWRTAPPLGCFGVVIRPVEYVKAKVSWDAIILDKVETYVSSCNYVVPEIGDCEAIPFERGDFGYTESTRTYPDNKDLYDSSFLKIRPEHLNFNPFNLRTKFENYFVTGYDDEGNYILNPELTDLRCKPIRHFKFPSNITSPFIYNLNLPKGSTNFIFPIGINIDVNVVRSMLVVARENGLITQEQYDNIIGFEILRGDDTYSRSVVGSGLLFDMYEYEKGNDKILYSNFPYNDLGDDLFHYQEKTDSLIPHPYNALKNNRFSFISPDLLHTGTALPSEMYVQGFLKGHSSLRFTEMEDHARWTILGRRARRTATTLAIAEAALETAIAIGTATGNQWFMGGLTFGTSLGLVGVGIISAANVISGFTKIGEYRYQWLETFRNLGASRNFAYYGNGLGRYSTFLKNDNEENQVFSLSVSKYLPQGHFDVLDTGTKETYKVNNYLRERSVFLSTGDNFLEYPIDYRQIDNNKLNSSASKNINSRIGCSSNTYSSNIASPYVTLRNYVPDQWGEIGSVRWLTTGKQYKFGVDNTLDATFGGSSYITTFNYWRKVPFFTQTAFNYPDKTAFEYSSKYNIGRTRFYCDYETDTEYNDLLIPFPDIDSDYRLDCLDSSNKFYVNSGKFYTSFRNVISFPVETRMNLNWRYGGKEKKEQFYPIQSDIEDATQEKTISIKEQEQILYANTYSLPNTYSGAVSLPSSYDREFYKKISENQNEVIWSEADLNETNRIQDPYLVYKPLNSFLFETENGLLKSLKEATANTAVARFTHGMQVFNTVDTLAEKITPQTQTLGTGGIFAASRPISFNNSSLGFTGTQHYNVLETEFGDIHIDSERGQILFLNNQGNQLEDISYSYQGQPSNMNKWFKKHLPFKIKRYFPDVDTDNPFKGLGISGGYDAVNKRAFITKLDYEPISDCVEYQASTRSLVINETRCNGAPQVPVCPEGYEYNAVTEKCERIIYKSPCPLGYTYSPGGQEEIVTETCNNPLDIVFVLDATGSQGAVINEIKNGISSQILPAIISQFGEDYRLGLVAVKDRKEAGQALFDILEPMSEGNVSTFTTKLNTVVAWSGGGAAESYDLAIDAVIENTREIDLNGDFTSNTLTIGQFREEASKVIVVTTDNPPGGTIDNFTWDVWENMQTIVGKAVNKGIQIFTYFTPHGTNCATLPIVPIPNPVIPIVTPCLSDIGGSPITPYAPYVLNYIAEMTDGEYSVKQGGEGISADLTEKISQNIKCTSNTEIITTDAGCVQDSEDTSFCDADVVLVVDISNSVSVMEMAQQKIFLIQIINHLTDKMVDDKVRVSLVSFQTGATIELNLTNDAQAVINAINNLPNDGTGATNTVDGLCLGRSALIGVNSRVGVNKNLILITDGRQGLGRDNITCSDATTFLPPFIGAQEMVVRYGAKLKSEGIFITTIAIGTTCETAAVTRLYGGDTTTYTGTVGSVCASNVGQPSSWEILWGDPDYPLSSVGNGLFGYSTYQTEFSSAASIAEEVALTTCFASVPINCEDCNFNETLNLCECEESVEPTYIDKVSPVELTNTNYFKDVSWTIAFKFEEKGFNSYHSFHPNFYNPHQDFFQTGFNSNSSKLWSHTLEDNSFQVFQGVRKPFIVETVVTNKNTSKFLNAIAIESEAVRYQDSYNTSQWWDKGFDTLTIYNNTDNSGRLKLTPLKNYRDLTKYPINNPDNTQTITFVPQDEKQLVNYFYNRTRREDRNIPQWISDRNEILKSINNKAVKFTGKQLLERLRGNSFIIRLENESESRFKINFKDVIIEETNYNS